MSMSVIVPGKIYPDGWVFLELRTMCLVLHLFLDFFVCLVHTVLTMLINKWHPMNAHNIIYYFIISCSGNCDIKPTGVRASLVKKIVSKWYVACKKSIAVNGVDTTCSSKDNWVFCLSIIFSILIFLHKIFCLICYFKSTSINLLYQKY